MSLGVSRVFSLRLSALIAGGRLFLSKKRADSLMDDISPLLCGGEYGKAGDY